MPKEHIAWIDVLRILACFCVVISHCCDPFIGQFEANQTEFLTGVLVSSFVRPCVPLFVMISGVLLLPIRMDMSTFYARRAKRLIVPFLFWSILLPVLFYFYASSGLKITNPSNVVAHHRLKNVLQKIVGLVFNFNFDTTALWFVYMLIGLYFFMPVISAWIQQASRRDMHWFLGFWAISMSLPYLQLLAPLFGFPVDKGMLGVCDWNAYGTFYYFSGFLGYLVLAYYLVNYPVNWSWKRTLLVAVPAFLLGYAATAGGVILTQTYDPANHARQEVFRYFTGINVALMTFSVFIILQRVSAQPSPFLSKLAALTFGVFLAHFFFVQVCYDLVYPAVNWHPLVKILLIASSSFAVTLLLVWLMSLHKLTRKVIM